MKSMADLTWIGWIMRLRINSLRGGRLLPGLFLFAMISGEAGMAMAQRARAQPAAPAAAAPTTPPTPAADLPDRTQASFGDWTVRCEVQRPQGLPVARVCEMALTLNDQRGQPIAQVVIGRTTRTDPYRMLVQLPIELRVDQPARLLADPAAPADAFTLPFRLCSTGRGGCFGEIESLPEPAIARMRARAENQGRLDFRDSAGREVQILFSFRGFGQAIDALSRETGG